MKINLFKLLANGVITLSFLILLVCFVWLIYPYNPATFRKLPHIVEPKVIQGGNFIVINIDVCKNAHIPPEISRAFVDGVIYQIPTYTTVDDQTGCRVRKVQIYVPKGLPIGKYFISTNFKFQVNPIRTVEFQTRTEQFEVIE